MTTGNQTTRNLAQEADAPAMLTPDDAVREFRALRDRIPTPEVTPATPALRRRLGHVNAEFVNASIAAVAVSQTVQTGLGRSDEDLRQEVDASGRWAAAIDEIRTLLQKLKLANVVRKQRIGLAALQTYKICQQLARDEAHQPTLAVHISEMKRLNKFGRARRKPVTEPEPAPDTKPPG